MVYFDFFSPLHIDIYLNTESCTFFIIWPSTVTSFEENKVFKVQLSMYAVLRICCKHKGSETSSMPRMLFGTCRAGDASMGKSDMADLRFANSLALILPPRVCKSVNGTVDWIFFFFFNRASQKNSAIHLKFLKKHTFWNKNQLKIQMAQLAHMNNNKLTEKCHPCNAVCNHQTKWFLNLGKPLIIKKGSLRRM